MHKQHDLVIEHVAVTELRPDPANPRRISDSELESLTRSIKQFGMVSPIVARRQDRVVKGQIRLYCDACKKSFTTAADQQPQACPVGHRPGEAHQVVT